MSDALSGVDISNAKGLGADIYRSYRQGELSETEYYVASAAMVADECYKDLPHSYDEMPATLCHYVDRRIMGQADTSQTESSRLGLWLFKLTKALDHNAYMRDHFMWAKSKCFDVGLTVKCEKIDATMAYYDRYPFPYELFERALRVQKMDSLSREIGKR